MDETDGPDPEHAHHARGTGPAEAFVVGPAVLAAGAPSGPLAGCTFAAKDLFDVAGTRTGAGNPDFLADAPLAHAHAPAVAALIAAGATLVGKTVSDELAYSLSGTNVHYGTPVNAAAPGHLPGGSSSGSAAAVAAGAVDVALGTDTGGSVRVPASYCGIYGLRPTHGRIPTAGVVALARTFDTVGLFARDADVLARAAAVLLQGPGTGVPLRRLLFSATLASVVEPSSAAALEERARALAVAGGLAFETVAAPALGQLRECAAAYRTIQMAEAWAEHGEWITARRPHFGPGVGGRFAAAAALDPAGLAAARDVQRRAGETLREILGSDGVLAHPAAVGPPPPIALGEEDKAPLRNDTLVLTAFAGCAGAPVLVVPGAAVAGMPVGLALAAPAGADEALCRLALAEVQAATPDVR